MEEVRGEVLDKTIILHLSGHIDSNNAGQAWDEIREILAGQHGHAVEIDASKLDYISSAGLRVLLRVRKDHPELKITGVSSEVYEILDMTGFTQMITVEKAYRVVSIEGCEEIGRGANGTIYRIDQDNVVKVYNNADALAEIQHEREVARTALVLGIPTAISYDVVRVGDSYGSVFELLNARSFSKILANEPDKFDWCVKEYVDLLRKIHGTVVPDGELPKIKSTVVSWGRFMRDYLPEDESKKLMALIQAVPDDNHMIHGDYHTKNVELNGDEVLLIDMDTLAVGHPIFELASMFNAFIGFYETNPERIKEFQGFDYETSNRFWKSVLAAYIGTDDQERLQAVEDKARVIGYTRLIRRSIRRHGLEQEKTKAEIEWWTAKLIDLLHRVDSLLFLPEEIVLDADTNNLQAAIEFIDKHLAEAGCSMKAQMQLDVSAEEIFVNIANYAYAPGKGKVRIKMTVEGEPPVAKLTMIDCGRQYNPLEKEDPDVSLSAEERQIGGLGIYMVKQSVDDRTYEYRDGQNILTMIKSIQ